MNNTIKLLIKNVPNTSYKYFVLGQTPIYDDEKNNLYKRLIAKKDYTI